MRYTHDMMAEMKGRSRTPKVKTELGAMVVRKLGSRGMSWLAQEVYKATGVPHDTSYFSHTIMAGRFRIEADALKAVCELLDIDQAWAFEKAGWPQPAPQEQIPQPISEEKRTFLAEVDSLHPKQRKQLERFLQLDDHRPAFARNRQ